MKVYQVIHFSHCDLGDGHPECQMVGHGKLHLHLARAEAFAEELAKSKGCKVVAWESVPDYEFDGENEVPSPVVSVQAIEVCTEI